VVRFVLLLNGGEPRPHLCGAGLLLLHGCNGPSQVESGDERHTLALIRPVVHALLPPGFRQGVVDHPRPCLADEFHGVDGGLAALGRDAIQRRDLLPETPIRPHFAGRQQHVHMVVPGLPVDADIHPHMEGIRQPAGEPFRQRGFLVAGEAMRQRCVDLAGRHGVLASVMLLHAIPERGAVHGRAAIGQDQGKRSHILLAPVVRDEPGPVVHHPGCRPVGGCHDRRAPLRPPENRHREVIQRRAWGGHRGLLGVRGACHLLGYRGCPLIARIPPTGEYSKCAILDNTSKQFVTLVVMLALSE